MRLYTFHYYLQHLVELVGGEAFDVFGTGIEVSSDVSEDSEMGIDGSGIAFEYLKITLTDKQAKPNTLIISDCMAEDRLYS